jgi:hypothetical protein
VILFFLLNLLGVEVHDRRCSEAQPTVKIKLMTARSILPNFQTSQRFIVVVVIVALILSENFPFW